MTKRKLLIGSGHRPACFTAGFGAAVLPASAELRTLTVTLLGGHRRHRSTRRRAARHAARPDHDPRHHACRSSAISDVTARAPPRTAPRRPQTDRAAPAPVRRPRAGQRPPPGARADRSGSTPPARAAGPGHADRPSCPGDVPRRRRAGPGRRPQAQARSTCRQGRRRRRRRPRTRRQGARHADATRPTARRRRPTRRFSFALPGPAPIGVPELLHRQVPHPAVPAADLPGGRHPVRRALGGPGRDQRDRDRLRAQPQRLHRRRRGLDAVHALHVEALGRRRQRRRPQGPLQPGRRDLRRRALPQGRRRRQRRAQGDLRLQPRRLVRRLASSCARADRRPARRPRRLAHRPDAGPLPRPRQGPLRRRRHRRDDAKKRDQEGPNAALPVTASTRAAGHQHLRQGRLARRSRCRTARSCKMGRNRAPGQASSSSATSTATPTRTRT